MALRPNFTTLRGLTVGFLAIAVSCALTISALAQTQAVESGTPQASPVPALHEEEEVVPAGTPISRVTPTPVPWATARAEVQSISDAERSDLVKALDNAESVSTSVPANISSGGRIAHRPDDELIAFYDTGVDLRDLNLYVEFQVPYSPAIQPWDFGIGFRSSEDGEYRFIVDSDGNWLLSYVHIVSGQSQFDEVIAGNVRNLNRDEGEWNSIFLIADHEKGFLFINGELESELDLSEHQVNGEVWLGTGLYRDYEREGETTSFRNLAIWDASHSESLFVDELGCLPDQITVEPGSIIYGMSIFYSDWRLKVPELDIDVVIPEDSWTEIRIPFDASPGNYSMQCSGEDVDNVVNSTIEVVDKIEN